MTKLYICVIIKGTLFEREVVFMVELNKYIVLGRENVKKYLNTTEYDILTSLLSKINQEYVNDGIAMEEFVVFNKKKVDLEKFKDEFIFKKGIDIGTRL